MQQSGALTWIFGIESLSAGGIGSIREHMNLGDSPMRIIALALVTTMALPVAASAQWLNEFDQLSFDAGVGASYGPDYMGSDDNEGSPWFILRNVSLGEDGVEKQGFSIIPSLNYIGKRDSDDSDDLEGMDDISRAYEVGVKVSYVTGAFNNYAHVRKGFGGHHGVVGEIGTRYKHEYNDRLTFWAGAEVQASDDRFVDTYFGVSTDEALTSGYDVYEPGGGLYEANVSLEARYMLNENWAVLGRAKYGRLLDDAADSPLVKDKNQPEISVGIVRHLKFSF